MHLLYGKNLRPLWVFIKTAFNKKFVPSVGNSLSHQQIWIWTKKSFFTHTDRINTIFKMQMCVTSKVCLTIHKKYLLYTNCRFDLAFIISLDNKPHFQLTIVLICLHSNFRRFDGLSNYTADSCSDHSWCTCIPYFYNVPYEWREKLSCKRSKQPVYRSEIVNCNTYDYS